MYTPWIWAVVHVLNEEQALKNAHIAEQMGADGVLLIHMEGHDEILDPIAKRIRRQHPQLRLGINYLSLAADKALQRSVRNGWDATWCDFCGVRSDGVEETAYAVASILRAHPDHLFFGGVAFKYQAVDPNPAAAALAAYELGMIPTTTGVATGCAPTTSKLEAIQDVLHGPLAVASGVNADNLADMMPYINHVLVSTGINADFHTIDPQRLQALMAARRQALRPELRKLA